MLPKIGQTLLLPFPEWLLSIAMDPSAYQSSVTALLLGRALQVPWGIATDTAKFRNKQGKALHAAVHECHQKQPAIWSRTVQRSLCSKTIHSEAMGSCIVATCSPAKPSLVIP